VRAAVFAIADGVMPSNEERGYVVRKLIRRAASYAGELGIKEPFLYKLVNTVTDVMKVQYPELISRRDDIAMVVKHEEESYANVFKVQLPIVNETYKKIASEKQGYEAVVSGTNSAFIFSDTYGVPFEVSAASAATYGISLDKKLFEQSQEEQRKKSRASTKIKGEIFSETFAKKVEALGLRTEFLGYEKSHSEAKVLAVLEGGEVILDATPFYGESGGQIGDWGMIQTASGKMEVEDAKRIGDTIVHIGRMLSGKISKGEIAKVTIDDRARRKIMANHTATHLLQSALRKVLGEHVRQTGSLVDQEHLRFDFTHMKKMDSREIARVEEIVSDNIKKAIPVKKEIKDIATAKREGAIALFGEKYADMVRVVTIGDVSKELCGGTHVDNTKDIGIFRIKSESSIASGTRRIVAVTGDAAREWMREEEEARNSRLKAEKEKGEEKKIRDDRLKEIASAMDGLIAKGRPLGRARLIAETLEGADMDILRVAADMIRKKEKGAVIVLSAKEPGKASFVISVPADLAKDKTLDAGGLAKELAKALGGSGGGRSDFAQGGGKDPARLDIALEEIIPIIERMIRGA
jgi:alanyl-tRNA synthetase